VFKKKQVALRLATGPEGCRDAIEFRTKVYKKHFQKVFYPHVALMYLLLSWYISNKDTVSVLSIALIELHTFHDILT